VVVVVVGGGAANKSASTMHIEPILHTGLGPSTVVRDRGSEGGFIFLKNRKIGIITR
jgi:hypothetical protein